MLVIANEVKQSHEIAASLRSSQWLFLFVVHYKIQSGGGIKMEYVVDEGTIQWQDHPRMRRGQFKVFYSKEKHGSLATIQVIKVQKGGGNDLHVHEESDDILYILSGRAKMEIEEVGAVEMKKGSCIRIPQNVKHRIYDVAEELIAFDVFAPPTR